jgi:hypothetical protein
VIVLSPVAIILRGSIVSNSEVMSRVFVGFAPRRHECSTYRRPTWIDILQAVSLLYAQETRCVPFMPFVSISPLIQNAMRTFWAHFL